MLMWFLRQMLPPNGFDQSSFFINSYLEPGNVKKTKNPKNNNLKLVFKNKKNLLFSSQRNN